MLGGLSWYSTVEYYRVVNEEVQRRLGGHSSASVSLQAMDFADVRACQERGDWVGAGRIWVTPPGAARRAAPTSS